MSGFVLDSQTGARQEVTADNFDVVQQGLVSGRFLFDRQSPVTVMKGNEVLEVEANEDNVDFLRSLATGKAQDFRLATIQEVRGIQNQEEFGDRGLEAAALGAAQGATFGLAIPALIEGGLISPETAKQLRDQNEGAFTTGEVASLLATGVAGAGVKIGGRAVSSVLARTPAGLIARGGEAGVRAIQGSRAVGAVAKALPGARVVERAAKSAAAIGAVGAVETGIYSAGEAITEASLNDEAITGEKIAAAVGNGLVFGALGGAVLGGFGGAIASKIDDAIIAGGAVSKDARRAVQELYAARSGQTISDAGADTVARSAVQKFIKKGLNVTDEDVKFLQRVAQDGDLARMAKRSDEIIDEKMPLFKQHLDAFQGLSSKLRDLSKAELKPEMFAKNVDVPLTAQGKQEAVALMDLLSSKAEDIKGNILLSPRARKGVAADLRQIVSDFDGQIRIDVADQDIVTKALTVDGAIDQAVKMDQIKRRLDLIVQELDDPNASSILDEVAEAFRQHLQDRSIYGRAGQAQEEVNSILHQSISNNKIFRNKLFVKSGRPDPFNPRKPEFVLDPKKAARWLKESGTENGQIVDDLFEQQIEQIDALGERIRKYYKLDRETERLLKELPGLKKAIRRDWDKFRETVAFANQYKSLKKGFNESAFAKWAAETPGGGAGAIGGFIAGGPIGGLAAGAVGAGVKNFIRTPEKIVPFLAGPAIPRAVLFAKTKAYQIGRAIADSTTAFLRGTTTTGKKVAPTIALLSSHSLEEVYRDRVAKVLHLNDPEELENKTSEMIIGLEEDAPKTAMATRGNMQRAIQYLASRVPPGSLPDPTLAIPEQDIPLPSEREMRSFVRTVAAVEDPESAIRRLGDDTLSLEDVQAVQAVHPMVYQEWVNTVRILAADVPPGLRQKRTMYVLFGLKMSGALSDQFMQGLTALFAAQQVSGQNTTRGVSGQPRPQGRINQHDAPPNQGLFEIGEQRL